MAARKQRARRRYKRQMRRFRQAKRQQKNFDAAGSEEQLAASGPGIQFDPELEFLLSDIQKQGDRGLATRNEGLENLYNEFYDPANPFSRMALAEKSLGDSKRELDVSASSQGKLYSGQTGARMADHEFQAGQARNALHQEYLGSTGDLERGYAQQSADLGSEATRAIYDTVRRQAYDIEGTAAPTMQQMGRNAQGRMLRPPKRRFLKRPRKPKVLR
jgi:hypothetical protein